MGCRNVIRMWRIGTRSKASARRAEARPFDRGVGSLRLERVMGTRIARQHGDSQKGDVRDTLADGSKARSELGFAPSVGLEVGLAREFEWLRSLPGMGDE